MLPTLIFFKKRKLINLILKSVDNSVCEIKMFLIFQKLMFVRKLIKYGPFPISMYS